MAKFRLFLLPLRLHVIHKLTKDCLYFSLKALIGLRAGLGLVFIILRFLLTTLALRGGLAISSLLQLSLLSILQLPVLSHFIVLSSTPVVPVLGFRVSSVALMVADETFGLYDPPP